MSCQDWKPVVWKKTHSQLAKEGKYKGPTVTTKKFGAGGNKKLQEISKIKDGDEVVAPKTIGRELGLEIQQARLARKITQKVLANQINEQASVIQSFENGTAIKNQTVLSKLGKALGVRFTSKKK